MTTRALVRDWREPHHGDGHSALAFRSGRMSNRGRGGNECPDARFHALARLLNDACTKAVACNSLRAVNRNALVGLANSEPATLIK